MSEVVKALHELMRFAPEIVETVRKFAGWKGLDLGEPPPDMRKDFAEIEAEVRVSRR